MPFVPVPNTIQVNLRWLWDGQQVENTLYFEKTGSIVEADVMPLLEDINSWVRTELLPLLNTAIQLIEVIGRILDAVDSLSFVSTTSLPAAGAVGGDAVSNNVAYAITFRSGLAGRSFRGRNYIPGLSESATTGSRIHDADRAALVAAYNLLPALAIDNGFRWVVVSRFSGVDPVTHEPIPRVTGVTTNVVAAASADNVLDSQRRRLPGRGI